MPTTRPTSNPLTDVQLESIVRTAVHAEVDRAVQRLATDLDLRERRAEAQYERRLGAIARSVVYVLAVVSWGILVFAAAAQR